jgi:hypothetical protein
VTIAFACWRPPPVGDLPKIRRHLFQKASGLAFSYAVRRGRSRQRT